MVELTITFEGGDCHVHKSGLLYETKTLYKREENALKSLLGRKVVPVTFEGPGLLNDLEILRHIFNFVHSLLLTLLLSPATNGKSENKLWTKFSFEDFLRPLPLHYGMTPEYFVKVQKYIGAYPLATSTACLWHQEPPVKPEGYVGSPVFFLGSLKTFIMNRIRGRPSRRNAEFLYAWFQGKRGAATVPDTFIQQTMEKHREAMSEKFEYVRPTDFLFDDIYDKVPITVPQIQTIDDMDLKDHQAMLEFHKESIEVIDWLVNSLIPLNTELRCPEREGSSSACFEKKRSEGGVRSLVRESVAQVSPYTNYLYRMFYSPKTGVVETRTDILEPITRVSVCRELREMYEFSSEGMIPRSDDVTGNEPLGGDYTSATDDCRLDKKINKKGVGGLVERAMFSDRRTKPLRAKIACITEPIKVRVLTKGQGLPQFFAKNLQVDLHSRLRECSPFQLIGREVDESVILGLYEKTEHWFPKGLDDGFWNSGDYSAATDKLNPYLSYYTINKILSRYKLTQTEYDCLRRVLLFQEIEYPESSNLQPVLQQKGQLMGSVLSFPVLCILNFVTYALSDDHVLELIRDSRTLYRDQRKMVLDSLPVLINGDDILFYTDYTQYKRWSEALRHVGFEKSLGKNLVSKKFVTINSAFFWLGGKDKKVKWFNFPNIGLLRGQSKLNNRDVDTRPIWDIHNELLRSCQDHTHLFTKLFLYYNREKIQEITKGGYYNLYLARSLGGCGFDGEAKIYQAHQKCLASYLYRRHKRVGEIWKGDLNFITKVRSVYSRSIDRDEGMVGVRVPRYQVPNPGFRVRREPIELVETNGDPWKEPEFYLREPVCVPPDIKPIKLEKLRKFPDFLIEHVQLPLIKNEVEHVDVQLPLFEETEEVERAHVGWSDCQAGVVYVEDELSRAYREVYGYVPY